LLQHFSDHKGSIIRELYTVFGSNYSNGSIVSVGMEAVDQDRTITVILAKHCIELPDDGSLVIRNMLEQF
jgi:hypothetical protein